MVLAQKCYSASFERGREKPGNKGDVSDWRASSCVANSYPPETSR
jgi:hypothetical protein